MKSSTALGFVIFAAVPMGLMFWNFKGVKTAYLERSEGFESIERELEAIKLESARLEDVNNNLMHQISIEKENNASLIKEKEGLELRLENYRDSGSPDLGEREWTADELKARKKAAKAAGSDIVTLHIDMIGDSFWTDVVKFCDM